MIHEEQLRIAHLCAEVYERGGDCLSQAEVEELALLSSSALAELREVGRYADECAHAIGVEFEAEGHATVRGPLEDVVRHIKRARWDAGRLIEVSNALAQETARLDWMLAEGAARFDAETMRRGIDRALEERLKGLASGTNVVLESKGDS